MTKKQKKMLTRILITLVVFGVLFTCEKLGYLECFPWYINFVIFLIPYLLIGYDIIFKAARNICHGQIFDENLVKNFLYNCKKKRPAIAYRPFRFTPCPKIRTVSEPTEPPEKPETES